jgi:hypothetical protein
VYLDHLLKKAHLLDHELLAYADEVVIRNRSREELERVIARLESLQPFLTVNKTKCGIFRAGGNNRDGKLVSVAGIPIVESYRYLSIVVRSSTAMTKSN